MALHRSHTIICQTEKEPGGLLWPSERTLSKSEKDICQAEKGHRWSRIRCWHKKTLCRSVWVMWRCGSSHAAFLTLWVAIVHHLVGQLDGLEMLNQHIDAASVLWNIMFLIRPPKREWSECSSICGVPCSEFPFLRNVENDTEDGVGLAKELHFSNGQSRPAPHEIWWTRQRARPLQNHTGWQSWRSVR